MRAARGHTHKVSQNGSTPRQPKPSLYFANSKADSKAKHHTATVHQFAPPMAGKAHNKQIVQPKPTIPRIEHSSSKTPQLTNRSPTGHTGSLHNQQRHAFRAKREYSSVHFKGLTGRLERPPARHFTSGISSTDYTEGRKPRLMYGH
jgi:hypothetical protein